MYIYKEKLLMSFKSSWEKWMRSYLNIATNNPYFKKYWRDYGKIFNPNVCKLDEITESNQRLICMFGCSKNIRKLVICVGKIL